MTRTAYDETVRWVYEAKLTPKSQLAALGLLGAANGGQLICTRERAGQLCGTKSWGATRRMLIKLKAAGLIHYRTNEMAYIAFPAYFGEGEGDEGDLLRAKSDQPRAKSDHEGGDQPDEQPEGEIEKRAQEITFRAQEIEKRAMAREKRAMAREKRADGAGVLVGMGGMVDPNLDLDQDHPYHPPPTPDRRWIFDLLTDPAIDIRPDNAAAAARLNRPDYVVKCVAAWWVMPDRRSAGLLVYWLVTVVTNPKKRYRPGPAQTEFLASEFYARHYERAWEMAGGETSTADPPRWVLDLPDPPRVVEIDIGGGQMLRIPDDAEERRRKYGGGA